MNRRTFTRNKTAQQIVTKKAKVGGRTSQCTASASLAARWLTVIHAERYHTRLLESRDVLASLEDISAESRPVLTVLVGKTRKTEILAQLVDEPLQGFESTPHLGIHLRPGKHAIGQAHPTIFVDVNACDFEPAHSSAGSEDGETKASNQSQHRIDRSTLGSTDIEAHRTLSSLLCGRALGPFADAVCYFISDQGSQEIIQCLADQARCSEPSSDIFSAAIPCVLVVYEVIDSAYDCQAAETSLRRQLLDRLRSYGETDPEGCINRHFRHISVVSVLLYATIEEKAAVFHERLLDIKQEALNSKAGFLFKKSHLESLLSKMLTHFCLQPRASFSFVDASRPEGFTSKDLYYHLGQVMDILPKRIMWMKPFLCPLVNSAITVSCYPPGSHDFPMPWLYERLYEPDILRALSNHKVEGEQLQPWIQKNFARCLKNAVENTFPSLLQQSRKDGNHHDPLQVFLATRQGYSPRTSPSVLSIHAYNLNQLAPYFQHKSLRTTRTCLSCLLRTPEKMLVCGHALCDICVRSLGKPALGCNLSTMLSTCPLCGLAHNDIPFRHTPQTAGIRVLCLDGGGVKGIIPLIFLQNLQKKLRILEVPLSDYFDFICGTSAGGLIAIGIFLMGWSIESCINTFEGLAADTFGRKAVRCRFLRGIQLALGYLRDGQYSASPIARAFKTHTRENMKMFNPLANDTKVAVVAVTAQDNPRPALFTNYNGGVRPDSSVYSLVRAKNYKDEVSISEAARCTSAAPWFFPAVVLEGIGSFQDGALQHNNPVKLAQREVKALWPTKATADFTLSLGTGWVDPLFPSIVRPDSGPRRFLHRLISNSMESMDGENIATNYRQDLDSRQEAKYHRINVRVPRPEPSLDDVSKMEQLKAHALAEIEIPSTLNSAIDLMLASLFYFELDGMPTQYTRSGKEGWSCSGQILCRLRLSLSGYRALYDQLVKHDAWFLRDGNPIARGAEESSVTKKDTQRDLAYFRRPVTFTVENLDESIGITIRNWVSKPRTISGLPKSANELIKAQMIDAPFGRADCSQIEKKLPQIPREYVRVTPNPTRTLRKRKRTEDGA